MPEQEEPNQGKGQASIEPQSPLVKAYIDKQIENAIKQHDESQAKGKRWRNSWRSASPITKGSFIMTTAIAGATIAYALIAWGQYCAMQRIASDNSNQTRELIDAANQMKNAAWNFKGSAQGIDGNIGNAVGKLQTQTEQTGKLVDESRRQEANTERQFQITSGTSQQQFESTLGQMEASNQETARLVNTAEQQANIAADTLKKSQRPWVNAESFMLDTHTYPPQGRFYIQGELTVKNTGPSIATEGWVMISAAPHFDRRWLAQHWDNACQAIDQLKIADSNETKRKVGDGIPPPPYGFVLAPNQETKIELGAGSDDIDANDVTNRGFSVLGCIKYKDQFLMEHTTRFCFTPFTKSGEKFAANGEYTFWVCNGLQTAD